MFCEGGTSKDATVARGKGVVLRSATIVKVNATGVRVLAVGRFQWLGVRAPSRGSGGVRVEAVDRSGGVTPPRGGGVERARERKFLAGLMTGVGGTGVGGGLIEIIK